MIKTYGGALDQPERRLEAQFAAICAIVIGIIVYGSLFPFDFHARPDSAAGPLRALWDTYRTPPGRGDWIANILLYIPLGFFAVQAMRRRPGAGHAVLAACGGLILSIGLELAQFYDRGRVSSMADIYANTTGALLGGAAGMALHHKLRLPGIGEVRQHLFVMLLLGAWLGYRLFPYAPVIDLHKYWDAVKPLIFAPTLSPLDLYRHTAVWLAVALLLESLFGMARARLSLLVLLPAVLLARILIAGITLSPAEAVGGLIASLAWIFLSRLEKRALVITVVFVAAVIIQGLEPFQFSATARPFGWIPFSSFMHGSLSINVRSFFEKVFTYGALLWLIRRSGGSLKMAVFSGGALVLCLRVAEIYIPGRSAEITDVTVLAILAGMMPNLSPSAARTVTVFETTAV